MSDPAKRDDGGPACRPPVAQFELSAGDLCALIEALDCQIGLTRSMLKALKRERSELGFDVQPGPEWDAEAAMGRRVAQLALLANQLETASTLGRVLLQYPQR